MVASLKLVHRAVAALTGRAAGLQQARWASSLAQDLPNVWVFLGPPGVGKGTYSTRMAKSFGMDHIAAGDLVRAEMKRGSELGKQMKEIVNEGRLLPDNIILRVMRERMAHSQANGFSSFLLDGFPRTADQAAALNEFANVNLALNLDLREEVLIEKCMGRRICRHCGSNYNIANIYLPASESRPEIVMPPLDPPEACAPHLEQRSDDNEETIRKRLEVREGGCFVVYHAEATPVEEYYAKQGVLVDFEITGGIPETLPRLLETLKPFAEAPQGEAAATA
ncbi:hypothetical protein QBZ16_001094 [Prototheca wickerhamii]|uniref:adenylate kinase n=1 Tax=Prototheca wickerhamii TaxID=3111 RepID=A0AAD9IH57_PROWI|nr:hypothetical protein QBZ16_001094 [Prototheca wickerhamii]